MNSYLPTPITLFLSIVILAGWIVGDFQGRVVVEAVADRSSGNLVRLVSNKVDLSENSNSPDITTNWFTGNSASMASQLPLGQTKKSDEDEHIAQGRLVGQSYGNDTD